MIEVRIRGSREGEGVGVGVGRGRGRGRGRRKLCLSPGPRRDGTSQVFWTGGGSLSYDRLRNKEYKLYGEKKKLMLV